MLSCVKYRAKKAGVPFNLELSDIVIPAVCPVLNIPIRKSERAIAENSPSMDKIFPELGYVKGNVRVISQLANVMKNSATLEQCVLLGEDASRLMAAREVHDASI